MLPHSTFVVVTLFRVSLIKVRSCSGSPEYGGSSPCHNLSIVLPNTEVYLEAITVETRLNY
jgi:hypothetical protein